MLAQLQVDEDISGKDSDPNLVVFAPKSDTKFEVKRKKKVIKTRPILESKIPLFAKEIQDRSF